MRWTEKGAKSRIPTDQTRHGRPCRSIRLSGKCYLEGAIDLKSAINRTLFQLKWGGHPNKELQRDWNDLGPENFEVEIVDELAYTEDQQDFRDDIAELQSIWQENLRQEETELY